MNLLQIKETKEKMSIRVGPQNNNNLDNLTKKILSFTDGENPFKRYTYYTDDYKEEPATLQSIISFLNATKLYCSIDLVKEGSSPYCINFRNEVNIKTFIAFHPSLSSISIL